MVSCRRQRPSSRRASAGHAICAASCACHATTTPPHACPPPSRSCRRAGRTRLTRFPDLAARVRADDARDPLLRGSRARSPPRRGTAHARLRRARAGADQADPARQAARARAVGDRASCSIMYEIGATRRAQLSRFLALPGRPPRACSLQQKRGHRHRAGRDRRHRARLPVAGSRKRRRGRIDVYVNVIAEFVRCPDVSPAHRDHGSCAERRASRPAPARRLHAAFAGYAARVRASFARQGAMALIGAALDRGRAQAIARSRSCRGRRSRSSTAMCMRVSSATLVDSAGGYAGLHAVSGRHARC